MLQEGIAGLRTFDIGVDDVKQFCGIGLEQPHMQVIVVEVGWHQGLMPFHRTVKALAKEGRVLLHARREGNKPLGADQAELVAHGFVQEDRGTHRVWDGPNEFWVKEVDTIPPMGYLTHPTVEK